MKAAASISERSKIRAASLASTNDFRLELDKLEAALLRLSSRERLVLQFLYADRLSQMEVGAVMYMTVHEVRLHHEAAMATLSELTQIPFPVL